MENKRIDAKVLTRLHKDCPDCLATQAKLRYSSDSSPEKKPEKRRSFLQAPKSYTSRLPAPSSQRTLPQPLEPAVPKTQPIPIPQLSPTGQNSVPEHLEAQEFFIGDRVTIGGVKPGTLLYFGNIHVAPGTWCGIALDEAEGSHDGLVAGTRYFTCRHGHGIFAPVEKVSLYDPKNSQAVTQILKSPVKVSQIPSKSKVCESIPLSDDLNYVERSTDLDTDIDEKLDKDTDDEILRLDENGIIRDSDEDIDADEEDAAEEEKPKRRQLPRLPRPPSHILAARLQRMAKALTNGSKVDESELDETFEKLKEIAEGEDDVDLFDGEKLFSGSLEEKYEASSLPHSATGSSGNEDSWSLGKDYMTMSCDGKQYLNITFDGESESKTSTQEPSEESPSPEFIFDQEMIEDGEFAAQPMEMSRDSSLGLLSSIALEKTDLLLDLGDDVGELQTSQETLEPTSDKDKLSPERSDNLNTSVEFEDGELAASTPYNDTKVLDNERNAINLNETYTQDSEGNVVQNNTFTYEDQENNVVSSQLDGPVCLNSTYTQEDHPKSSQLQNTGKETNLNSTFTLDEKVGGQSAEVISTAAKLAVISGKEPMVDSGISLKGSMTESGGCVKSVHSSLIDTGLKGTLMENVIKGRMLDSGMGHSVQTSMVNSTGMSCKGDATRMEMEMVQPQMIDVCHVTSDPSVGLGNGVNLDDRQLMSDLKDGHQKKERPISFLSTTSADTGYAPDTDSEIGTLTLNSPQEWMDRGFHGNMGHTDIPPVHRNLIHDFQGEKLPPIPVESDSDLGTMNGDTDNETERPEVVHPVSQCEVGLAGVTMENISEIEAESEDEITQIENCKDANKTVTLDTPMNETFDAEDGKPGDGTFTLPLADESQKPDSGDSNETTESLSIVTVVIADKDQNENEDANKPNQQKKKEKAKTPKKKKFNVVKDFKKPNTTNVVSKLSEYLKAPLPSKPKEEKTNTEEAKNKRNSMGGGKIDLSKVTSKINNKSPIEEKANEEKSQEFKREPVEKEPIKKVKRTQLKSKWDAIMSQIDSSKDQKPKPKTEVKSKLEAILKSPPPLPPKKEEAKAKPKRRISTAIPDYSKVQSKLKYTAPPAPPKPKDDESKTDKTEKKSPSGNGKARKDMSPDVRRSNVNSAASSPSRGRNGLKNDSPSRSKTASPVRNGKDKSPARGKLERGRRMSREMANIDRERNLSGDSIKRPEIRDKQLHIDLADSLDGRGSKNANGSVFSSRQSSHTDMSTTGAEEDENTISKILSRGNLVLERASSLLSERRDSTSAVSEVSEPGSQTQESTNEEGEKKKSALIAPTNCDDALDSYISAGPGARKGRAKIVKPVARQHSAPNPSNSANNPIKPSMFTNQAPTGKAGTRRSRNQNRNKTSRSKKDGKDKVKVIETVPAEVHTQEVQRLEALCESRTKQLNLTKLELQTSNQAFDSMSVVVNYVGNELDGFSCPRLLRDIERLNTELNDEKEKADKAVNKKRELQDLIAKLKEEQSTYIKNLEMENERTITYQRETLDEEFQDNLRKVEERHNREVQALQHNHAQYISELKLEHTAAIERLQMLGREDIKNLQRKQDNQMEELHKQHQDKLEDITGRFDSIKLTLSDKVETLRQECDRLRDRARVCEEALQRDSDYKVQCALAPYKNLPQEIESLKMVVEMKNEEINKLRNTNIELQKKLEELPIAQEKIIGLQQKKENLEAIISMKTDHEKVLHERCQNLMKKYDKESRASKRLSMEYEELMWKLSESFSNEPGSPEAAFYKKLGMSPTPSDGTHSPDFSRRLKTPSGSDGSPSKSPSFRRNLSSNGDDREDKKFKRRSGNFLLDSRRPSSPLAKQNPLTQSWSPSTPLSSSPPPNTTNKSANRMSQSWCVDMDNSSDTENIVSKLPKSRSSLGDSSEKVSKSKKKGMKDSAVSDSHDFDSYRSVSKDDNKDYDNIHTNGMVEVAGSSTAGSAGGSQGRVRRDTVTLSDDDIVFKPEASDSKTADSQSPRVSDISPPTDLDTSPKGEKPAKDSVTLQKGAVLCPPSKLPTFSADRKSRSHRESAV